MEIDEKALEAAQEAFDDTYDAEYINGGWTSNTPAALRAAILAYESSRSQSSDAFNEGVETVAAFLESQDYHATAHYARTALKRPADRKGGQ